MKLRLQTLSPIQPLLNPNLDVRYLTIDLDEERFITFGSLNAGDFTLVNAPPGTTIEDVTGSNDTIVVIDLAFDGTDFDSDYLNFAIDIDSTVLVQTETEYLRTIIDTIFTFVEPPTATLAVDLTLTEASLDLRSLSIKLGEDETFTTPGSLLPADFTLVDFPAGISIDNIPYNFLRFRGVGPGIRPH